MLGSGEPWSHQPSSHISTICVTLGLFTLKTKPAEARIVNNLFKATGHINLPNEAMTDAKIPLIGAASKYQIPQKNRDDFHKIIIL